MAESDEHKEELLIIEVSNEYISSVDENIESDDYERDVSDSTEVTETVLKDIEKLKRMTQKNNNMLESLISEYPVPLVQHLSTTSTSSESPRFILASPRVMNQDLANMKTRMDSMERFQLEIITKMNNEFITILNRATDEMSLQSIKIEELQQQIAALKMPEKKKSIF